MKFSPNAGAARRWTSVHLVIVASAALSGCATLPSSGPTGSQITHEAKAPQGDPDFHIVEVSASADLPALPERPPVFARDAPAPPTDLIGPGDLLDIAIYEAGVGLFANPARSQLAPGLEPTTQVEKLPPSRVDDNGYVRVPFAGALLASGHTTSQLEAMIRQALRGMSQDPQVIVTIRENITNSVVVGGEVAKPGRIVLSTNRETLSDAIAIAGGYKGDSKDYSVRIQRRDLNTELRLSDILSGPDRDLRVFPGDKIAVIRAPRSFSVMGAPGKVDLMPFNTPAITLAEAVAQAGGPNPDMGDPQAIFVFRFVKDANGQDKPTVYHLNMMKPQAYFLSQRFIMRDKDVLYVGNAQANQPAKLIQIISQLFTPIVTVSTVLQNARN